MLNLVRKSLSRIGALGRAILPLLILTLAAFSILTASDHGDAPIGPAGPRQDANLTDLHAFVVGQNLVLALSTNPAIPPSATSYLFPTDVTFEINIDNDSAMDEQGQLRHPERIREDITFRIRFDEDGSAEVRRIEWGPWGRREHSWRRDDHDRGRDGLRLVGFYAGLRDDPFIRGPRQGRNVGAIVLEIPLSAVLKRQGQLVLWATSEVREFDGPFQDLAGQSLVSMFPENALMNSMEPRQVPQRMGKAPDVLIFNAALPAVFPNGRALTDDVVDLVGDNRVLANDAPFPSVNDKPFLAGFPYLAEPH
jgi:hypothetical protein